MSDKKLIVIRASTLYNAIPCDQYARYYYVDTLEPKVKYSSVAMEYGTAFHTFAAELLKLRGNFEREGLIRSLKKPLESFVDYILNAEQDLMSKSDEWKNPQHLKTTCIKWFNHCKADRDSFLPLRNKASELVCEKTLFIPYYQDKNIEVLLRLTIDRLGFIKDKDGLRVPILQDFKITSNNKKEQFLKSYELNTQMSFYHFCISWMAEHDLLPPEFKNVNIQILAGFIRKLTKDNPVTVDFQSSQKLTLSSHRRKIFKLGLDSLIQRISSIVESQTRFGLNTNCYASCKKMFGNCTYFEVCKHPHIAIDMLRKFQPFNPTEQQKEDL